MSAVPLLWNAPGGDGGDGGDDDDDDAPCRRRPLGSPDPFSLFVSLVANFFFIFFRHFIVSTPTRSCRSFFDVFVFIFRPSRRGSPAWFLVVVCPIPAPDGCFTLVRSCTALHSSAI